MAKIVIKSEKFPLFGGIFPIIVTAPFILNKAKGLVFTEKIIIFAHSDAGSTTSGASFYRS